MKIHNFIKDTKGMAQIELDSRKKRENNIAMQNEQIGQEAGVEGNETPAKKGRKKKAQAEEKVV